MKSGQFTTERQYGETDLLRIAKRQNNAKRPYLLVNPLQAKHIPVSPMAALEMMQSLGNRLAVKYPAARLVVAFAETATAIGAVAAHCLGPECIFLATTREYFPRGKWIEFQEEHSHATEQRLSADHLATWVHETDEVILLDDEFSTGRTLRNMVEQLREAFPELREKAVIGASLLNRVDGKDEEELQRAGIRTEFLLKLPQADLGEQVSSIMTHEAEAPPADLSAASMRRISLEHVLPDPRRGCSIGSYESRCAEISRQVVRELGDAMEKARRILVLGTEECMYPALFLGREIEGRYPYAEVFCHATTRSPIGISEEGGYPIREGVCLPSVYEAGRRTYLYCLRPYDLVLVFTDAPRPEEGALKSLQAALAAHGNQNNYLLEAGDER